MSNCIHLPPDECYVKPGDAGAFRRFSNFLMKICSILSESNWNQLDNPEVLCMLMAKLLGYLQDRWNRQVFMIRQKSLREPKLTDLIDFISKETVLVNDSLFSRHAVSQYVGGQHKLDRKDQKKGKIKNFLTGSIDETPIAKLKSPKKCPVCEKLHDIEDCPVHLTKSVEERSKLLYKLKLCYCCLEPISNDQNARKCLKRETCNVRKERHLTTLHGLKWKSGTQVIRTTMITSRTVKKMGRTPHL